MRIKLIKNKKGWIRIMEALISILIISIVLLIVIQRQIETLDFSEQVYRVQDSILTEIRVNQTLREEVINTQTPKKIDEVGFPDNVRQKILEKTPTLLNCETIICETNQNCLLLEEEAKSVYTRSAFISSTDNNYSPKKIKMACTLVRE